MADARQRDAEATWPVRGTASVVMIEEAGGGRENRGRVADEGVHGDRRSRSRLLGGMLSCTTRVTGRAAAACPRSKAGLGIAA